MNKACDKCKAKSIISLACGGRQASFCSDCYNNWLSYRDSLVSKIFGEYIEDGVSPKKSSPHK